MTTAIAISALSLALLLIEPGKQGGFTVGRERIGLPSSTGTAIKRVFN